MALHGHTKIELTNVNTGEVETYEDDNMVTNALEDLFHPLGFFGNQSITSDKLLASNNDNVNSDRLLHTTTGGLLLFDKSLKEDPELTIVPAGVSMTGHACYRVYTGNDPTFGSYNNNESGLLYDGHGYKHVWDFQTNQANGKISCACLTTALGGIAGTGSYPYVTDFTGGSYEYNFTSYRDIKVEDLNSKNMPVYFNGATNELLSLKNASSNDYFPINNHYASHLKNIETSFLKTGNLHFIKRRVPFNNLSIFDFQMKNQTFPVLEEDIVVHLKEIKDIIPEAALKMSTETKNNYCFDYNIYEDNGYLLFMLDFSTVDKSSVHTNFYVRRGKDRTLCHVWKINANTFETKYYKIINPVSEVGWTRFINYEFSESNGYTIRHLPSSTGGDFDNNFKIATSKNILFAASEGSSCKYVSIDLEDPSRFYFIVPEGKQNNENASPISFKFTDYGIPPGFLHFLFYGDKIYFSTFNNSEHDKIRVVDLVKNTMGYLNASFNGIGVRETETAGSSSNEGSYRGLISKIDKIKENIFVQLHGGPDSYHAAVDFYMRIFYMPNMLITINNLPQTITKTDEQTMKVTYTLVDDSYEVD